MVVKCIASVVSVASVVFCPQQRKQNHNDKHVCKQKKTDIISQEASKISVVASD